MKSSFEGDAISAGNRGDRSGMRAELRQAIVDVIKVMSTKAEQYVEDTAKADGFVGRTRKDVSEKLAGIRKYLSEPLNPTYYKRNNKPASAEQLAEFDAIAERIVAGEALETRLIATDKKPRTMLSGMRWSNDALEQISAIMKAVRGRQGFAADNKGTLDDLRASMTRYSERLKMLADAQSGAEKTKAVPTSFRMDARELDQGRGEDYWTTPHEMAARAFQGYVEDKIAAKGGKSPFLNYAPEKAVIETPWGWKRPYPHGAERKAINSAFDRLVDTIQTRETDAGVAMFKQGERSAGILAKEAQRLLNKQDASVKAVQSYADLDPEIRAEARRQGAKPSDIKGVHWRGKSWVVADNVTADEVQRVALHEGMHGKLRQAYGREVEGKMVLLASNLPGTGRASLRVLALAKAQGINLSEYASGLNTDTSKTDRQKLAILTEELLTHVEEGRVTAKGKLRAYLEAVVGAIRAFLRKHGFAQFADYGITDIQHLLRQAREYGEQIEMSGEVPAFNLWDSGADGDGLPLFSRREGDPETDALVAQYANLDGAPSEAEIREARKQYRETEQAYGGREAYEKAKADGRTKLNYGQWVTVRTPNFKRWFGDWEALFPAHERGLYQHEEAILRTRLEQWLRSGASNDAGGIGRLVRVEPEGQAEADKTAAKGEYRISLRDVGRGDVREQTERLISLAREQGFYWNKAAGQAISQDLDGGKIPGTTAEHEVFKVGGAGSEVVIRRTKPGQYGIHHPVKDRKFDGFIIPAPTPAEYIRRLEEYNAVFPHIQIRVIGVSQDKQGRAVIWTAQRFIQGEKLDSEKSLKDAMKSHGWREVDVHKYRHDETGVVITDAHMENVLRGENGELFPFDVGMEVLPAEVNPSDVSKVTDPTTGEPMVVYHGTGNLEGMNAFDPEMTGKGNDQIGSGFYFTTDPEEADRYTQSVTSAAGPGARKLGGDDSPGIAPVFLAITNPINVVGSNLNDSDVSLTKRQASEIIKMAPGIRDLDDTPLGDFVDVWAAGKVTDRMIDGVAESYVGNQLIALEADIFRNNAPAFREAVKAVLGRDGATIGFDGGQRHYVAFLPNQIKSATGNVGTFGPASDIRFALAHPAGQAQDITLVDFADEGKKDWFIRKVQDKFFPVKQAQAAIRESGGIVDNLNDVYLAEERIYGKVKNRIEDFEKKHVKPLVEKMAELGVSADTLDLFLYARHARERNAHIASINPSMPDGGSGMTNETADRILAGFRHDGTFQTLALLAERVYAINRLTLEIMEREGLETPEYLADLRGQYSHYVPLRGKAVKEGASWFSRVSNGYSVKGKEFKRFRTTGEPGGFRSGPDDFRHGRGRFGGGRFS